MPRNSTAVKTSRLGKALHFQNKKVRFNRFHCGCIENCVFTKFAWKTICKNQSECSNTEVAMYTTLIPGPAGIRS